MVVGGWGGLSRPVGSSSSSSSSRRRTELLPGPRPPSHPHPHLAGRSASLCCFPALLFGMTKVPRRQTPVKNISIHGFRPVKDEELHFDTERRPKGGASPYEFCQLQREGEREGGKKGKGRERKRGATKRKKINLLLSLRSVLPS